MIFKAFYDGGGSKYFQIEILGNTDPARVWESAVNEAIRLGKASGFELTSLRLPTEDDIHAK